MSDSPNAASVAPSPADTPVRSMSALSTGDLPRDPQAASAVSALASSTPPVQSSVNVGEILCEFVDRQRNSDISSTTGAWNRLLSEMDWLREQLKGV